MHVAERRRAHLNGARWGTALSPSEQRSSGEAMAKIRAKLSDEAVNAALEVGRSRSIEEAVALAREE